MVCSVHDGLELLVFFVIWPGHTMCRNAFKLLLHVITILAEPLRRNGEFLTVNTIYKRVLLKVIKVYYNP